MISFFVRPFNCFCFLGCLNALLAYTPMAWPLKFLAGVLGFGFIGYFYLKNQTPPEAGENPFYTREFLNASPEWVVPSLILAMACRLYHLTTYLIYPLPDEVINAYNAIHMKEQWAWNFFYYRSQMPPFYTWLLSGFFKFAGVSVFNLWLLPGLLSFFSVLFYYFAFREVFSKSISLVCLYLLSAGFWPVFIGRFSHNAVLMIFWESLCLWLLVHFAKGEEKNRFLLAASLALCLGLGFYTYFAWPLLALWFLPAIVWICERFGAQRKNLLILTGVVAGLSLLPLTITAWGEGFGQYLLKLFLPVQENEKILHWDLEQNLNYFTCFLWKSDSPLFGYNPQWGGFLNPILGSLFLMGAAEGYRLKKIPLVKWLAMGFVLQLIPCIFTHNANWYHVAGLMPLFLVIAAWGVSVVWSGLKLETAEKILVLLGFFLISFLLDWNNLNRSMGVAEKEYNSSNLTVYACAGLEKTRQLSGIGRVYTDFSLDDYQIHTLGVTNPDAQATSFFFISPWRSSYMSLGTYSYNTLLNPSLNPNLAAWAAFPTDEWTRPLFFKWFPGATIITLENLSPADDNLMVYVPLTGENQKILESWDEADRAFREFDYRYFNHPFHQSYDDLLRFLQDKEPLFRVNPLFRFYYWGKLAEIYSVSNQNDLALSAIQRALQEGANGYLYNVQALLFERQGRYAEEKDALFQAAKWNAHYQPSPETLQRLDSQSISVPLNLKSN